MTELPRFIGMVHLPPLPGAPRNRLTLAECEDHALRDAHSLAQGGAGGLIIENFGDVPFRPGRVDPHTIASMTRIALRIRHAVDLPVGINVLRNDALSALGIAYAVGGSFIRVNILSGTMATDQGLITGEADRLMRLRRELDATNVKVLADVLVKHAAPLADQSLEDAVVDLVLRGLADAVVVSGSGTGKATSPQDVRRAVETANGVPVFIGSGATIDNIADLLPPAHGIIAGTGLKRGGNVGAPVDPDRVRQMASAITDLTT